MTLKEEIAELRQRIAKAQSDRDTWLASGRQEKYLEAYSLVEALELRLDGLHQQGLLALRRSMRPASDAADLEDFGDPGPGAEELEAPGPSQRELMAELDISFRDGVYRLGVHRYDRLVDAVAYARVQRRAEG
jgi:hypothetical protein